MATGIALYGPDGRALLTSRDSQLLVKQGGGPFEEAVRRGNVYGVANQTGVTSQSGLSATTPVLTLYNPPGSGKLAVIWYIATSYAVAFAGGANIWVAVGSNTVAAVVTGTLATAHRNMLVGAGQGNKVLAYLAATLPAAPVGVCLLGAGLTGAITTIPYMPALGRWFDGGLVLKEGTNLSVQTSTASGTNAQVNEFIWEEVDA